MNQSENISDLAAALAKAQAEVRNPHFDSKNPHFNNRYASLAAHVDAVRCAFPPHGLSILQWIETPDTGRVTVTTRILHSTGQWIEAAASSPSGNKVQELGSAVTYLRRYCLAAICGIVGEDDDDGERDAAAAKPPTATAYKPKQSPTQAQAAAPTEPKTVEAKSAKGLAARLAARTTSEDASGLPRLFGECGEVYQRRHGEQKFSIVKIGAVECVVVEPAVVSALGLLTGLVVSARVEHREGKMSVVKGVSLVEAQNDGVIF